MPVNKRLNCPSLGCCQLWSGWPTSLVNVIRNCILTVAAIIAVVINSRHGNDLASGEREPASIPAEISNSKSQISDAAPSCHGWPADAPPPAIAPFNTEQAKQHQEAEAKYLKSDVEYTDSIVIKFRLISPGEFTMGSTADEIEIDWKRILCEQSGERSSWNGRERTQRPQRSLSCEAAFISASAAESSQTGGCVCRFVCTMARAMFRRGLREDWGDRGMRPDGHQQAIAAGETSVSHREVRSDV